MRCCFWLVLATLAAAPVAWSEDAPPASDNPTAAREMTYYPPAARAAGVQGKASVACDITEHLGPRNCALISESPSRRGFGQAAVAIAQATPDNPKVTVAPRKHLRIDYVFSLKPAGIYPHPGEPFHIVVDPVYLWRPTQSQLVRKYPRLAHGPLGSVILNCFITIDGRATNCKVLEETPAGHGYGQAALEIAATYKMKPGTVDGETPKEGVPFLMAFNFGQP